MVTITYIIIAIIFLILIIEIFKHKLFIKTKGFFYLIIIIAVFLFFILGYLSNEGIIKSDNSLISTGAAIISAIEEKSDNKIDISPSTPFKNSPLQKKK